MSRPALPRHIAGLLALAVAQVSALDLPYNPTHIVIPEQNDQDDQTVSYAYILQPNANGQTSLLSLDLTRSLQASKLSLTTLYNSLPFLSATSNRVYTPLKGSEQNITVVAGDCSTSGDAPEVWTFIPATNGKNGNGTWLQSTPAAAAKNKVHGPDFLSSGIAFSDLAKGNASTTSLYVFGGMCPLANATDETWMSAANYTNQMMTFSPELDSSKQVAYTPAFLSSKGPPVAEAGFSMTPLAPAFSDNSSSTQSARQSFVLVGGHTGAAFINMSSVALFSLPEETWTYQPVDQPSAANTDLAVRGAITAVEPRSGHTAVLTEDGKSLILFGGWVGDVTNAASPQLAVLELGSGYGGDGDWEWSVPLQTASGLSGAGIYGHGAAMLPGGVMMIMGGYNIPTTSSKRFLRRSTSTSNSQNLFYNVTSRTWIQSYSPPPAVTSDSGSSAQDQRKGALTTTSQKAGLGVGLTIGAIAVGLLIIFYFWYKRHLKRRRDARESDRERLSTTYEPYNADYAAGGVWQEKDEDMHDGFTTWTPNGVEQSPAQMKEGNREVERSGVSINAPSPTRGLRKNGLTRSQYQYHAAPRYDDGRISKASGNIHPIQERDEEEERFHGRSVARTSSTRSGLFFGLSGHPSITPSQAPSASVMSRSLSPAYWENRPKQTNSLHPPSLRPGLDRAPDSSSTQCTTFGQLIAESEVLLGPAPNNQPTAPLNPRGHTRAGSSMSASAPRRAASDSSQFLGTRRGPRDWEGDENDPRWQPYRDDPDTGDWGDVPETTTSKAEAEKQTPEDEREDWDVEEAAANRDIQVMFTVPKARLRVVNADVDKASLRSISDGAKSIRARQLLKEQEEGKDKEEATETGAAQRKPSNYGIQIQDWEREALEKRDAEEEEKVETSKKV
ncbi:hypothetical protein M436DRAFT_42779 [Aureobasidium namibiae CBS 147.97]|uniref:Galactose oxidase n=1 Tax=Aureobasidium namibiae CBS 147.97 TaxID=1043004 RepID=A0A074WPJ0_9PEZI|nr:uncharacterized protein M436DRAFT_42779 [Aureobasidium namibiae CBS 147.97]KEQ75060.1 hypothetical protein M436DRAFT_42779 [Aureobasidium namibiae CBS 147.97]